MNDIEKTTGYLKSSTFIESLIIIVLMFVILRLIKKYLIKKVAYTSKDEQHKNTFIGVLFNILQYVVVIVCVAIVLKINGVNVTSIVAGLGIIATLVGLALQDTMKDVISGINIYNNNFYKVGDLVKYNGEICEVKYFSARVTKFQSFLTGNTYTVCNSSINTIEKIKDISNVIITFDFEDDKKKIDKCFNNAYKAIEKEKYLKGFSYLGLIDINNQGIVYLANIISPAHKIWPIRFKYLTAFYEECKKENIAPNFSDEVKVHKF